jgi:hypothetical protein
MKDALQEAKHRIDHFAERPQPCGPPGKHGEIQRTEQGIDMRLYPVSLEIRQILVNPVAATGTDPGGF